MSNKPLTLLLLVCITLNFIGSWFIALASMSSAPFTFLIFPIIFLLFSALRYEFAIGCILLTYSWLVFWAGLSLEYNYIFFDNLIAIDSDERLYFKLSNKEDLSQYSMVDLLLGIVNAPLAVKAWRFFYDFYNFFGVERKPWIGIQLNIYLVTAAAYLTYKSARIIFSNNSYYISLVVFLFANCGMVWLFGALHVRDGFILLLTTCIFYSILQALEKKSFGGYALLVVGVVVYIMLIPLLRAKLLIMPVLFGLLIPFARIHTFKYYHGILLIVLLGVGVFINLKLSYLSAILETVEASQGAYKKLASSEDNSGLAYNIIINQPAPIRLLLGFVYQHLMPIPLWAGLAGGLPYHWFKSAFALLMLIATPYAWVGLFMYFKSLAKKAKKAKKAKNEFSNVERYTFLFYLFCFLSVSMTSLESRHVGQFLPAFLISAVIGYSRRALFGCGEKIIIWGYILSVTLIYIFWMILKFL